MSDENRNALKAGHEFDGYRIESVLGAGGFGITYRATEVRTGRKVAIKEFLQQSIARRDAGDAMVRPIGAGDRAAFAWGLERFLDEAKVLVTVNHPNVVRTLRYTEAHGTAYIVMDFVEGGSLGAVLLRAGTLAQAEIEDFLFPLLEGLAAVHAAGFLHRDIKPDNIYIRADTGQPVLLDFGAARLMARDTHSAILTHGFAPPEQYQSQAPRAPSADLYALGATLYRCMTETTPPRATDRISARALGTSDPMIPLAVAAKRRYAPTLIDAVERALNVDADDRPQSVAEFVALILRGQAESRSSQPSESDARKTLVVGVGPGGSQKRPPTPAPSSANGQESRPSYRRSALAAGLVVLLAAGAMVYVAIPAGPKPPDIAASPPATPRPPAETREEEARKTEEARKAEQVREAEERRKEEALQQRAEAAAQKGRAAQQRAQTTSRQAMAAQAQARTAAQCARTAAGRARSRDSGHNTLEADSWRYDGQYSFGTDQREGCGVRLFNSGERYEGQWKQDKPHGYGILTKKNGERYEGSWSSGKANGYGIMHYSSGDEVQAAFVEGNITTGPVVWTNKKDFLRYEGEARVGEGILIWHGNGVLQRGSSRFEGEFADGALHGFGVRTNETGQKFYRCWIKGDERVAAC